jgi:putative transposase
MQLSFKTKLKITPQQDQVFAQHAGFARWVYNWGLATIEDFYKSGLKLSCIDARKFFTNVVKPEYPWMSRMSSRVYVYAFQHLDCAYKNFFTGRAKKPNFKKKGKNHDSFTVDWNGRIKRTSGKSINLPGVVGTARTFEKLPEVDIKKVSISHEADGWYISFNYEIPTPTKQETGDLVAFDLGIKSLAVTYSQGKYTHTDNPKAYYQYQGLLANLQRRLKRLQKGSKRHSKLKLRIRKIHQKIARIRNNTAHQLTTKISNNHAFVVMENLNVSGMMQNCKLSKALSDCALGEIERQIKYKCEKFGVTLIQADRFFPSTKQCPQCKTKHDMPLSERNYYCSQCGYTGDRDETAALNLWFYGYDFILNQFSSTITGELPGSGRGGLKMPTSPIEATKE